jgi:hypothetical protein
MSSDSYATFTGLHSKLRNEEPLPRRCGPRIQIEAASSTVCMMRGHGAIELVANPLAARLLDPSDDSCVAPNERLSAEPPRA